MGQALVRLLTATDGSPELVLCGATASPASRRLGLDAATEGVPSGVRVTADVRAALAGAAVALDFSPPEAVAANAAACAAAGVALVVGSTGLGADARTALDAAGARVPVLLAPNTSVGVAVLMQLVRQATLSLGTGFDIEIAEAHHRQKRDAPSGTALALGEVVAAARGVALADIAAAERHGATGPRVPGSVGFSVLRGGDIVGEHTVVFAADGERLEITHRVTDRAIFARGALRAAAWLAGRPAGRYGMEHVLGLREP